ncbi:MAG TPA: hypothetical protein VOA80_15800, partial [Thermoanaerobaculia bacterium]|nr:hypothetical protein [Thermoanaerobaculia bacterium]
MRTADELFRFDAEQFGSLIGEQLAMGKVFAPVVDPWSEEEALALFTLAWALRKPGQAHAILAPVLRLGPQFLDFFGAREGSAASAYGEEEGESDEGQASAEEDDDPEEENLAVGQVLDEEIAPADGAAVAGIEEEIEETEPGPRGAELASRQGALESAADRRRQVGGSSTLDVRAIKLALEAETGAQERLADTQQRISAELQNKLTDLRSVLEGAGVPRFAPPVLADARDMAAWLDRTSQEMEKVLAEGRELQRLRGLLVETGGRLPDPPSAPPWPFSTAGALTFLREIAAAVDRAFGEARRERETLEAMRERFADCLSPRRAKSIGRLDAQSTRELLQAAQGDETTRQLTPALCRRLSDVEEWDTSSPAAGSLELLGHCLEQAAMHGESEHQAAPSFLPRRTLEALLASGHEMVARHLVLITFRESLARPHPFFFEVIWPYEKGWANRQRCVGERLHRLFTDLQMLFWEAGLQPVLEALVSNGSEEASGAEEADRLSARAKRQAAENLAVRLETVSMSGHYHRVRQLACNLFFRPLTDSIRERRVREVQSQLALLQRRFASGELEQVAVREYPERNELRSEHRVSLRRYLEANLDAVDQWVRQEASLLRSRTIEDEDKLHKEVRTALARLPSLPHADHEELGSVEWLEHAVGEAIVALRQNRGPRSTCLLFGDLPPLETLFAGAHASGSTNTSGVPWPPWLDADPRSERIWCSYVHGAASWQDLLHDGIAKQLLGRRRSPREVMESLLAAGEFEAAVQAARYPGFGGEAIAGFAAQAAEAAARRGRLERQQEDLDRRLRSLERSANSESLRQILEHLPAALLELIDLAEVDLDAAARRCEEIAGELGRIEERVQSEESDKRERFEWLRSWLAGAGVGLAAGADLAEAEGKIVQIRERERPRRLHLLRLSELDAANVPEPLRSAVHSFLAGADRPDRWLTREESERIDLYLDYLVDAARGWWEMLRGLDQEDGTFRKIQEIAALLAERLPEEMAALAEQREDSAPMLTLAAEWRGQPTAAEYYRALQERQLLGDEEETIAAEAAEIQVEAVPAWVQLQARIERSMMHGPGVGPVTGRLVQEAFTAFGEERYEAAAELARAAWSWARGNGAAGEIGPLVAVYNWSCLQHDGAGFERSKVEALGLVLRNLPRIRERARLQPEKWLAWWNQVM